MFDINKVDQLARSVLDKLPAGFKEVRKDLDKNLHQALQSVLAKMDLVTREEFEVQSAVLLRSREKLEALEKRVSELEANKAKT